MNVRGMNVKGMRKDQTGGEQTAHHSGSGLRRELTAITNGAWTFASVGVFGGLMSLYGFSMSQVGGSVLWGWPIVAILVGAIVLVFAELASTYSFVGSIYQWPSVLAGRRVGWAVGWLYLGALIPLMTAYAASEPVIILPLFGWTATWHTTFLIILFTLAFAVVWNLGAVRLLGRFSEYSMILEVTVASVILLIVFIVGPHHGNNLVNSSTVVTSGSHAAVAGLHSFGSWLPLFLGGGIFVAFWVLYTFENSGTLGEETVNAGRNAPTGVLGAYIFAVTCGFLFLISLTASLPNLKAAMLSGTPAEIAVGLHMPEWVVKLFLFVIAQGLLVATCAMFGCAVRHIYGMARDNQIPFSGFFRRVLPGGSPWAATLTLGVLSVIPVLVFTTNTASIVGGATGAMYVPYFAVMVIALVARSRRWPTQKSWFRLGVWGWPANILAVLGSGFILVDIMWPRALTNPDYAQITGHTTSNFFAHIPMGWYIVGVPVIIGVVYYAFNMNRLTSEELAIEQFLSPADRAAIDHGGVIGAGWRRAARSPANVEVPQVALEVDEAARNPR
jgi:amino acid transporter